HHDLQRRRRRHRALARPRRAVRRAGCPLTTSVSTEVALSPPSQIATEPRTLPEGHLSSGSDGPSLPDSPSGMTAAACRSFVVVEIALLAAVYVATGKIGLSVHAVSGFATVVWAPSGIALAALLLCGLHLWPGVLLGAFILNRWQGASIAV